MKMKFKQHAPDGAVFAPNALDGQIGKEIRVNLPDGDATTALVLEAEVASSGQYVELTIETSDINLPAHPYGAGSFGFA